MKNTKLHVKGIILDLDGTLVDSRQAYLEAARTAFSAVGQQTVNIKTAIEIPKRFEQGIPLDDLLPEIDVNKFRRIYLKSFYQAVAVMAKPLPDTANSLKKLSEKAKLALTTKRKVPNRVVIQQLKEFGLERYFQTVVTACDKFSPKPSPDALIECSRKLGLKTSECAVVGDSIVDIEAGRRAGAKTVAVVSGIFSRDELKKEKPDLILTSVRELPDFLE
jgi:HAD superfamily hydrolase (TIGR01509 family)